MVRTQPLTGEAPVANGAAATIAYEQPYQAVVTIRGTADLLFHAWNNESVAAKAAAAKGSKAKKTDDVDSYVYRNEDGHICLPGRYVIGSIIDKSNGAAKYRQDPRSPRKSALDLFKAGVQTSTIMAPVIPVGTTKPSKDWDYLDRQRVVVQRSAVTRERPAFRAGWEATVTLMVLTPEYIPPTVLLDVLGVVGRLVGVGDFRPSYGRYAVTKFDDSPLV